MTVIDCQQQSVSVNIRQEGGSQLQSISSWSLQQGSLAAVCPASELLVQPVVLRWLALHVGFLGLCLVQLSGAGSPEETTLKSRGRHSGTLPTGR